MLTKKFFNGINENFTIDNSTHSIFGASKVGADIMVQEYGKYFGMPTCSFKRRLFNWTYTWKFGESYTGLSAF